MIAYSRCGAQLLAGPTEPTFTTLNDEIALSKAAASNSGQRVSVKYSSE
jgi:hypothetical protein